MGGKVVARGGLSSRTRLAVWGAFGLFTLGCVASSPAVLLMRYVPMDRTYFQGHILAAGFSYQVDERSLSKDWVAGEASREVPGGVTVYQKINTNGHGRTCDYVASSTFLKPPAQRSFDSEPFIKFEWTPADGVTEKGRSAGTAASPELVEKSRKEFDDLVRALTK